MWMIRDREGREEKVDNSKDRLCKKQKAQTDYSKHCMSVPCQKMYLQQDHFIWMSVWSQMDQDIERSSALWELIRFLRQYYDNEGSWKVDLFLAPQVL